MPTTTTTLKAAGASGQDAPLHSILALGFPLGLRHATDSDHVVAVTTIAAHERRLSSAPVWIPE